MAQYTVYPYGIDSSNQLPIATDNVTPVKGEVVNRHREAIIAIESELGIQPSGTYTTVRARLDALDALIASISHGGGGGGLTQVLDEGTTVRATVTELNFIGAGVTATSAIEPGRVDITVTAEPLVQKQETIAVTSNGQTAFTLSATPSDATAVEMFVNGIKQQYSSDYTAVGTAVTYSGSISLVTTDVVEFWYIVSGGGGGGGGGSQTLSATLALGNTSGGYDILLTSGSKIYSPDGYVFLDDNVTISGKLTVAGLIDPTGLSLTAQSVSPATDTIWIKNTSPTTLFFTDGYGQDFSLNGEKVFGPSGHAEITGVVSTPGWTVIGAFYLDRIPTTAVFEAVVLSSVGTQTTRVRLYDVTIAAEVTSSILSTTSTSDIRLTSANIALDISSGRIYQIQAESTGSATDFSVVRYALLTTT